MNKWTLPANLSTYKIFFNKNYRKDNKNMKTLYAARFARVTENLARQGLTQMIVSDPPTIFYLTGVRIQPGERMLALLLRADGNHRFFVNALFGTPEPDSIPQAFLMRTAAGGVLVMKEKEWSAYTVMTTGMIMPISFFVRSLNSFVNTGMATPC